MKCPRCASARTHVLDSRSDDSVIRRRRECDDCQARFSTLERVEHSAPMVVKKDGRRELFDINKIRAGVVRACEKRPVSMQMIDHIIEKIEKRAVELCIKEMPSAQVGEFVMEELKRVDHIAYVRFASVYREFSDVSQFVEALNSLQDVKRERRRKR